MFGLDIQFNTANLKLYTRGDSQRLRGNTALYVRTEILPLAERRMNRLLQKQPGKPKYPIRWTSEKQRRFVMAKLSKAKKLPYPRSGDLARNWEVVLALNPSTGEIIMRNDAPSAQWVYGDKDGEHQQRFHKDTGWPLAEDFFRDESKRQTDQLLAAWPEIVGKTRES